MKKYLVGGAIRDTLLNNPVTDSDWVIVGAKPQELLQLGFQQVGKDFPVFLHPVTKEEYALARTERKSGAGYTGFVCDFDSSITLEQDLLRRDLTINAIAMDESNNLIDPYGGINDLNNRILRHVSPAFTEDPLRVLRVARFAARYYHFGFTIATETLILMQQMVKSNELHNLTPERVWQETLKALATDDPQIFFNVLKNCGALAILFPELNNLFGVPQPERWHPEIDSGVHTLLALKQATLLTTDLDIRFAVLCHDFGKALTPSEQWPHHKDHDKNGVGLVKQLSLRLKIPNQFKKIACLICRYHEIIHHITEISACEIVTLLNHIDVWRNPEYLEKLILSSLADFTGRKDFSDKPYPQANYLMNVYLIAKSVAINEIIQAGFVGQEIHNELNVRRINAINEWKLTHI